MARLKEKEMIILESAADCFLSKGFSNTTIQDIADGAQVSKGSIYTYFSDKEELFIKAAEYIHKQAVKKIAAHNFKKYEFTKRLEVFIRSIVIDFDDDFKKIYSLILGNISSLKPNTLESFHVLVDKSNQKIEDIVSDIIKQGYDEGKLRKIDEQFDAPMILGMIFFITAHYKSEPDVMDKEKYIEKLLDFVINGMGRK